MFRLTVQAMVLTLVCSLTGCLTSHVHSKTIGSDAPSEASKVILPEHVIAPPDILLIDAVALIPRPPYLLKPLDALYIQVKTLGAKEDEKRPGLIPGQAIDGVYRVDADGSVDLGFDYGTVRVAGQGVPEAKKSIKEHLLKRFKAGEFDLSVSLAESRAMQQIRGEHLVQPDGKIVLGTYGYVNVTGMTLEVAKATIEEHLSRFLLDPEISLDIAGFNSRVYYVVFNLDGAGEQVYRLPVTGNETVMDAVAELKGLPANISRKHIWVTRAADDDPTRMTRLPVNWKAISSGGSNATNYQIMPGDRVFVGVDPLIATDNFLAKVISPIERILGVTLLTTTTVHAIQGKTIGTQ